MRPVKPARQRALRDRPQLQLVGRNFSGEIHVEREVQRAAVPFSQFEQQLDMPIRFGVERGCSTDPVDPERKRLAQEVQRAGRFQNSELRIGEDLQVQVWREFLFQPQEQLDA